jgi:parallel beta-helix repeat protein
MKNKVVGITVCMLLIGTIVPVSGTITIKKDNISPMNDGTLSGYVNDASMNPIEGALVRVYFHGTYEEDYTDSSGYYHVENIPICYCMKNCTASKSGYKSNCVSLSIVENTTYDFTLSNGTILYVGGSGPGNYSSIQEAVDNALDGDTVFVYSESSPYNESVTIAKSLTIQGEDKLTTIIDRSHDNRHAFSIKANNVIVTGFTIQNTGGGIYIGGPGGTASYNTISDNIILNTGVGISIYYGDPSKPEFLDYGFNTISNNVISNTTFMGISITKGRNNTILGNSVSQTHGIDGQYGFGIDATGTYNNISYNHVFDNDVFGIIMGESYKSSIYRNTIENNGRFGLAIGYCSASKITQNNFIDNQKNAKFFQVIKYVLELFPGKYPIRPAIWNNNYWDKPRSLPVLIPGFISLSGLLESYLWTYFKIIPMNCLRVDLNPAQEPFDI